MPRRLPGTFRSWTFPCGPHGHFSSQTFKSSGCRRTFGLKRPGSIRPNFWATSRNNPGSAMLGGP
jgi:hypothetical protein